MRCFHDSRDPLYRSPGGAQPCGTSVRIRLRVDSADPPQKVLLRVWDRDERFLPMTAASGGLYEAELTLPERPCLLWYDFHIWYRRHFFWYGNAEDGLGGAGAPVWGSARSFQITVYDPAFTAPEWVRGAVFYQIFPDRFAGGCGARPAPEAGRVFHANWDDDPLPITDPKDENANGIDFFGGTLNGITEKLPYLASLGVTALYLNPVFKAHSNHRYDTEDYRRIDPLLGNGDDFRRLCEKARQAGIRIVLDGVFNHTGSTHPFFLDARAHEDSPYRDWYLFRHWPDDYVCWWDFVRLPDLNKENPEVCGEFFTGPRSVLRSWLQEGAAGWRFDVADELPMELLRKARDAARETVADALMLGEVWEDASNKISYGQMRCYCLGDTLDGVMNYPLRAASLSFLTGEIDASVWKRRMDSLYENYPEPFAACLLNVMGTHDRARCLNVLTGMEGKKIPRGKQGGVRLTEAQKSEGKRLLLILLAMTVAMPGMPCVYYGDEAGMEGTEDPFCRRTFPWGKEDRELTEDFRTVLARKKTCTALQRGTLSVAAPSPDVLIITRQAGRECCVTAVNRGLSDCVCTTSAGECSVPARSAVFLTAPEKAD